MYLILFSTIFRALFDDYFNVISLLTTVTISICSIIFINRNTDRQIDNQNKTGFKPRLKVLRPTIIDYEYFESYKFLCFSANHIKSRVKTEKISNNNLEYFTNENVETITIRLPIRNIGNGLARNIKLFNLLDQEKLIGILLHHETEIQHSFSSLEIENYVTDDLILSIDFISNRDSAYADHVSIMCFYEDLFDNQYELLINLSLKIIESSECNQQNRYSIIFSYIQGDSKEFKKILINDINYKSILKIKD